ncbi:hypothetical protein [Tepidiforma sp.]|uniref:RNA recognition motif domain-containing protein n=1 Tax=Tepidiforma sp. TaxID=2682230 RepID=UPI0026326F55|nr:hypothetical protein [Tepidiforma sp.]MCX7616939.1 RNA-binding protein [Tepidiforma sp.]
MDLYIGNLSYLTTEAELRDLFAPFGPAVPPHLVLDAAGISRGYALVPFDDPAAADAAVLALNGSLLHGRVIIVRPAAPGE